MTIKEIYNESALLTLVKEGDAGAFARVHDHYRVRVFDFAFALTKSSATAEDIGQDVFAKIWERRGQIDLERSFPAYLKKITFNHVISYFRKVKLDQALQEKLYVNMQLMHMRQEATVTGQELALLYRKAIDQLPPQKKTAYLLSREEELSYEEIAARMGISKNTVRNHMTEAIQAIRRYIGRHYIVIGICLYHSFRQ